MSFNCHSAVNRTSGANRGFGCILIFCIYILMLSVRLLAHNLGRSRQHFPQDAITQNGVSERLGTMTANHYLAGCGNAECKDGVDEGPGYGVIMRSKDGIDRVNNSQTTLCFLPNSFRCLRV